MNIDFLFILFNYLLFTYLPDNLNHVVLLLPKNFIIIIILCPDSIHDTS